MEIIGAFILGWASGWLVNYLADVLPAYRRFVAPVCQHCNEKLTWRAYLTYQKCPACGARRSLRTWVVQAGMAAAAVIFYLTPPAHLGFWIGLFLLTYFCLVAVIDLEYKAILIQTSIFGLVVGVLIGSLIHGVGIALLGGVAGAGIMFLFYEVGILFIKFMERVRKQTIDEVALGLGDVYLMAILGLLMGWPEVIGGMLLAFLGGGLISGLLILGSLIFRRYKPLTAIPYAPFLLLGAFIMIYIPK